MKKSPEVGQTWLSPNNNLFRLIDRLDDLGNFWWRVVSLKDGSTGATVISPRDDWKFIS